MATLDEGTETVQLARHIIETYVKTNRTPSSISTNGKIFNQNLGVFVTIHTHPHHELRGCIGVPLPIMPLKDAIVDAAQSATRDPRFPPLTESELDNILIEVTILTTPQVIKISQPKEYLTHIKIGRDGLIAEQGFYKGLLLPQVPVEQGWSIEEFLSHTCMKAGLLPDAWFDTNTKISKFNGQVFTEVEPKGKIMEKRLNGCDT
jgi:hypothetical protein